MNLFKKKLLWLQTSTQMMCQFLLNLLKGQREKNNWLKYLKSQTHATPNIGTTTLPLDIAPEGQIALHGRLLHGAEGRRVRHAAVQISVLHFTSTHYFSTFLHISPTFSPHTNAPSPPLLSAPCLTLHSATITSPATKK
jgi:hypothetical protein